MLTYLLNTFVPNLDVNKKLKVKSNQNKNETNKKTRRSKVLEITQKPVINAL